MTNYLRIRNAARRRVQRRWSYSSYGRIQTAATRFTITEQPVPRKTSQADYRAVTQDYFKTMGIPISEVGRDFTDREMKRRPRCVGNKQDDGQAIFLGRSTIGQRTDLSRAPRCVKYWSRRRCELLGLTRKLIPYLCPHV